MNEIAVVFQSERKLGVCTAESEIGFAKQTFFAQVGKSLRPFHHPPNIASTINFAIRFLVTQFPSSHLMKSGKSLLILLVRKIINLA